MSLFRRSASAQRGDDPYALSPEVLRTEALLYEFYDRAIALLASRFHELASRGRDDISTLLGLARYIGHGIDENRISSAVHQITWEPIARSSVLELLHWLLDALGTLETESSPVTISVDEWSAKTAGALDRLQFTAETALPASDQDLALRIGALSIATHPGLAIPQLMVLKDREVLLSARRGDPDRPWEVTMKDVGVTARDDQLVPI